MKAEIYHIKKNAGELERAYELGNIRRMQQILDEITLFCDKINQKIQESKDSLDNLDIEPINRIPFLYKPVLKKDYYEGSYLEEFAQQRTYELQNTRSLNMHNKFWQNHEVVQGNIFASLPAELVNNDSIRKLKKYGWQEVNVDILEVKKRKCTIWELIEYCEQNYGHFIIVNEKSTGAELILYYLI